MILQLKTHTETLSIRYHNEPLIRAEIDRFKVALCQLFDRITEGESEEHYKNILADFLKTSFYSPDYEINTKDRQDLAIHTGRTSATPVGVIVEVKRPENIGEMFSPEKPNSKALYELIHYYFQERLEDNKEIKHLIITNLYDWYFFDANDFEKLFYGNKKLRENYIRWKQGELAGKTTDWLYQEILKPFCEKELETLALSHCKLRDYETQARQEASEKDIELDYVFKLFSQIHLLKLPFGYDANQLNEPFYFELLHVLGLMEKMENGILKIKRIEKLKDRNEASFLENTIQQILVSKKLENGKNYSEFGENLENQLFSIALELCITWLNRILFLKLLEGQLLRYHSKNPQYAFLHIDRIQDFDELDELFFEIFNKPIPERKASVVQKYGNLPYLNSALFEITDLEKEFFRINSLKNRLVLPFFEQTAIKDHKGVSFSKLKNAPPHKTLPYLFAFLNAYDFGSEAGKGIRQDSKTIMNAAVLGLIFEKINGYEDGSFFTPQFITEYMCRETVRKAVLCKFQEVVRVYRHNGIKTLQGSENLVRFETVDQLKESLNTNDPAQRKWANEVVNSVRICDPAVGSGHFLVAVLNELILLKHELDILCYRDGYRIKEYTLVLDKDEFEFLDAETNVKFVYKPISAEYAKGKMKIPDRQRFQEAIFHEKQTLIENCLFGVDINAKSVSICRLRLWIELLKNAYYTQESQYRELQTLPNIDINIKAGNSLVSRFGLNGKTLNPQGFKNLAGLRPVIERYKLLVRTYKESRDSRTKDDLRRQIAEMKREFEKFATPTDKDLLELRKKEAELTQIGLSFDGKLSDLRKAEQEVQELHTKYKEKVRTLYYNAFEWRFEFPEILDEEGNFVGFDAIVGNPPYIRQEMFKKLKPYLEQQYEVFDGTADLLTYFFELAHRLLANESHFAMVVSNKFSRANYGKELRHFLSEKTTLQHYIDFSGVKVFDKATVDVSIVSFAKRTPPPDNSLIYCNIEPKRFKEMKNQTIEYVNRFGSTVLQSELSEGSWAFQSKEVMQIKNKVEAQGVPLKDWNIEIFRGIVTGLNEAFVVDEATKNQLIVEDSGSAKILKPLLRGRDIHKYYADYQNLYLIGTFPSLHIDIEKYPAIKKYLLAFGQERLEQNSAVNSRKKTGNQWFETQDQIAYWKNFEKPKIIYPNMTSFLPFMYDESGFYTNDKSFMITGESLKYLVAIFNAKLFKYCFSNNFPMLGLEGRELRKVFFEQIPIKKISETDQKPFIKLVNQILKAKKESKETAELEAQIDELVFDLYGLTAEERQEIN